MQKDKPIFWYHLVIGYPEEDRVLVHDPNWEPMDDTRAIRSLVKAVKQLEDLDNAQVSNILEQNGIQHLPPEGKKKK